MAGNGIKVEFDLKQTGSFISRLKKLGGEVEKTIVRGLNKAVPRARTIISAGIRDEVRLKKKYVDSKLVMRKARSGFMEASVRSDYRGALMTRYQWSGGKRSGKKIKPIRVNVKGGGARVLRGAFYVRGLKAGKGEGARVIDGIAWAMPGRYANGNRKIRMAYGPSPAQVFRNISGTITPKVDEVMVAEIAREIARTIKRNNSK